MFRPTSACGGRFTRIQCRLLWVSVRSLPGFLPPWYGPPSYILYINKDGISSSEHSCRKHIKNLSANWHLCISFVLYTLFECLSNFVQSENIKVLFCWTTRSLYPNAPTVYMPDLCSSPRLNLDQGRTWAQETFSSKRSPNKQSCSVLSGMGKRRWRTQGDVTFNCRNAIQFTRAW